MRASPFVPHRLLLSLAALSLLGGGTAAAQDDVALPQVISAKADALSMTVYRDPDASAQDLDEQGALNPHYLSGFAMITEQRKIHVPQGRSVLRFEGVAASILSVSAVIEGLPGGTIEKNRDARLLSPASLVDGSLGRRVTLTRTNPATGASTSEDATILAGPEDGIILRTPRGIEALQCSGLPEALTYDGVPAGLSRKPVLSVVTDSPTAQEVTVTLSYLASDFDWRASYVATVAPDGQSLELFAWLTLANGNGQNFANADIQAVAGRLERVATPEIVDRVAELRLQCFPTKMPAHEFGAMVPPPPPPAAPAHEMIVVTAQRRSAMMVAPPEDLGDLKLYRVPERVDMASLGQKQVALLRRDGVKFSRLYRQSLIAGEDYAPTAAQISLNVRNEKSAGLGLPLPMGSTALYQASSDGQMLLLGRSAMADRAEGEEFQIDAGSSSQVFVEQSKLSDTEARIIVTNANREAVEIEIGIGGAGQKITAKGAKLTRSRGQALWRKSLRGGQRAELRYRYDDDYED